MPSSGSPAENPAIRPSRLITIFLTAALIFCCSCSSETPKDVIISGKTMGTGYLVKVPRFPSGLTVEELHSDIDAALDRINAMMSTYRSDSEISRFNRYTGQDWFEVSQETAFVVEKALEVSAASGGAFDVTVGPLVDLWNFGPEEQESQVPGSDDIKDALAATGFRNLRVRRAPPALRKELTSIQIDLSAIAKGFAVDRISRLLSDRGIADHLVDIGGEIRTRGRKIDGSKWSVGIEAPDAGSRRVLENLSVGDCGLATSGDYRRFFEHDGTRYSHTIDPRTGRPVEHGLASVTVAASSCMDADAWATALMVLGPEAGLELAVDLDLAAFFIVRDGEGYGRMATPLFEKSFPELGFPESRRETESVNGGR